MKFTYFIFKNFKGIENQKLDFTKNSNGRVYSLVGLNESGKTTILEAINYFAYKSEDLKALELNNYDVGDIHNLIPINKRDNFNDSIKVEGCLELEEDDIDAIKKEFSKHNITITSHDNKVTFTQNHIFENSKYIKTTSTWNNSFYGKKGKGRIIKKLPNEDMLLVIDVITKKIPSILYFPNFLFEFPEKIYLDQKTTNQKHKFYQNLIQDILDSLGNNTNIEDHLIKRIKSADEQEKRNLTSLVGKMQRKLTEVIFEKWNQIFKKEISRTEIILQCAEDSEKTPYIELYIKDDVDTYRINERSLGFRWFFVYILLTQFRSFRKKNNNVFFLFDEPASNLHPSAQMELLKSFSSLSKVLYTTHSHYLINPLWLENTYVIKNEAIDYDNEISYKSKNTNIKISKYREFSVKHPNQTNYYQPILEILNYKPSNIELVSNAIIVEGKYDFYCLKVAQKNLTTSEFDIIPGSSSSNMETLISLYIGWEKKFIIILDSDKEGEKQKHRYIEIFGDILNNKIYTYKDIDENWKNHRIEDFFSEEKRKEIQNIKFHEEKYDKKKFNNAMQEILCCNNTIEMDKITTNNFNKIFIFFKEKLK